MFAVRSKMGVRGVGFNDFGLKVVGSGYDNEDGSSRQLELARCRQGEIVDLVRERDNPHDPSAVAVFTDRGVRIGYIGANYCGWIGGKIDRGYPVQAIIGRLRGGRETGQPLSAVLTLNMEGEEPD